MAAIECELADLATTRQTLLKFHPGRGDLARAGHHQRALPADHRRVYPDRGGLRAKDVCLALGIGTEPQDTEGIRAKLKRLVNHQVLTETQPGLFTLSEKRS